MAKLPEHPPRMGSRSLYLNLTNLDRLSQLLARFNSEQAGRQLTASQVIDRIVAEQVTEWEASYAELDNKEAGRE